MTSSDLKITSDEPIKTNEYKLKGGDPSNVHISGKDLTEQVFSCN